MLTRYDDFLVHQTPEPVAQPGTSDRNFYDRYFFNGYARDASVFFAAAMGLYPNRRVMDAAFSVVRDGTQWSVHASRLAPVERSEARVGPVVVEVQEPLRRLRVIVEPNVTELTADVTFHARTEPIEEPRFRHHMEGRLTMDLTRLTQFGTWEGWIDIEGRRIDVQRSQVVGCRDRSWGVRIVGEPENGAPGGPAQFFWLWAPVHFPDCCTHFAVNEDAAGRPWHASGSIAQAVPGGMITPMARVAHRVTWQPGTRRAASAEITLTPHGGSARVIRMEPVLTFQMLGLGYLNAEWGHGHWKGEQAIGGSSWRLADCAPLEPRHLHVQALCRASMDGREGIGVLEQLVIGPHAPSGFTSLVDPAP